MSHPAGTAADEQVSALLSFRPSHRTPRINNLTTAPPNDPTRLHPPITRSPMHASHKPTAERRSTRQAELRSLQLMRASLAQLETTTADFLSSLQAHQATYTNFAEESDKLQAVLGVGASEETK